MRNDLEFIGEIGVNHNGDISLAKDLLSAISESGARTAKLQLFRPEALVTRQTRLANYQIQNGVSSSTQSEMLEALTLKPVEVLELNDFSQKLGLELLVTPFDIQSMEFVVEELGHKRIKFSSGDLTFHRLIFESAKKGVHLLISTGMSTMDEIQESLEIARAGFDVYSGKLPADYVPYRTSNREGGTDVDSLPITLLHCTSTYPAPVSELNVTAINAMSKFGLGLGYSDHSLTSTGAILALAYGARIFEKHVTLSKALPGPDHAASLTPVEFKEYVSDLSDAFLALGSGIKVPQESELDVKAVARRGLYATRTIRAGEVISGEMVSALRPESIVNADKEFDLIGTTSKVDLNAGDPFE
jgi:N-acetylneuraminate synthase